MCSANWHGALTQFRGRGAVEGRARRGGLSRVRVPALAPSLALVLAANRTESLPFSPSSSSLPHALFRIPSLLSAARIHPRECAGHLRAYIADFTSRRWVILRREIHEDPDRRRTAGTPSSSCGAASVGRTQRQHFAETVRSSGEGTRRGTPRRTSIQNGFFDFAGWILLSYIREDL